MSREKPLAALNHGKVEKFCCLLLVGRYGIFFSFPMLLKILSKIGAQEKAICPPCQGFAD
jgi:hypothetical protein